MKPDEVRILTNQKDGSGDRGAPAGHGHHEGAGDAALAWRGARGVGHRVVTALDALALLTREVGLHACSKVVCRMT